MEGSQCPGEEIEVFSHGTHQQVPGLMHRPLHRVTHTHFMELATDCSALHAWQDGQALRTATASPGSLERQFRK